MANTCLDHTGHSEKISGMDSRLSFITWLLGLLIGLVVTINSGFFIVLWNMNTTLTGINSKMSVYDKVFEAKLVSTKEKGK